MAISHPKRVGDLLGKVYRLVADGELPLPDSTPLPAVPTRPRRSG